MSRKQYTFTIITTISCIFVNIAIIDIHAHAASPSTNMLGAIGLNTTPSARMQNTGILSSGISLTDPYTHGFIGLQIADPLHITLRQSAERSSLKDDPDRFYPGIDAKLRLRKESKYRPAVALGITSANGHTRMSGEYIAASKRFGAFDFTLGLGWGRYGSALQLDNPLSSVSSHFN